MGQKSTQEESVNSTDCFWPRYAVTSHSHRSTQYYARLQAGSANVTRCFQPLKTTYKMQTRKVMLF